MANKNLCAVYGSLRKGLGNHGLIANSNFVGETISEDKYTMFSLGYFPGIVEDGETNIVLEVYEVDADTELRLDRLEGYVESNPERSFYIKKKINTEFGEAFIYIYNGRPSAKVVEDGNWTKFITQKNDETCAV